MAKTMTTKDLLERLQFVEDANNDLRGKVAELEESQTKLRTILNGLAKGHNIASRVAGVGSNYRNLYQGIKDVVAYIDMLEVE